jgi:hypothetical protein
MRHHIDPEELELYAVGRASEEATARCEEHLLICETCRQALEETDSHVAAMRGAAARLPQESPSRWSWWEFPRWAPALAALILAVLAFSLFRPNSPPPVAVTLAATRGAGIEATVPAGRRLSLTPDLIGLPPDSSYRLEVVDDRGRQTWAGGYNPALGSAAIPAQREGTHFVRIYSAAGELLREYGLEIKR